MRFSYPVLVAITLACSDSATLDEEARTLEIMKPLILNLEVLQLRTQGKHIGDSFTKMRNGIAKAQDAIIAILSHPKMAALERLHSAPVVVKRFVFQFGNHVVAQVLVRAKESSNKDVVRIATKLLKAQFESWGRRSAANVFKLMKLDDAASEEYRDFSWKITVLNDYIAARLTDLPLKKTLLRTLVKGYGGMDKLVAILHGARQSNDDQAKQMAETQLTNMFDLWKTRDTSPERAVDLLKMKGRPEAFTAANLDVLAAYTRHYYKDRSGGPPPLIKVLSDGIRSHGQLAVALSTQLSKKETPQLRELQLELFKRWCASGGAPENVIGRYLQHIGEKDADLVAKDFRDYWNKRGTLGVAR
uniref:Uncharacterized protein n=1 Tax=Peronospora matthiolae TaxID=2874970 RepID=A0AAV1TMC5_9STRA